MPVKPKKPVMRPTSEIDTTWTLFLDRDGVINKRIVDDYVKNWSQFKFLPRAEHAIKELTKIFGCIIIVTNSRGIARGLMRRSDIEDIHKKMLKILKACGGKVRAVYYCPHDRTDGCDCRKPNIGMAKKAKRDFPKIDFTKAYMVGDSATDMEFGRRCGMKTAFITGKDTKAPADCIADSCHESLHEFYKSIKHLKKFVPTPWPYSRGLNQYNSRL